MPRAVTNSPRSFVVEEPSAPHPLSGRRLLPLLLLAATGILFLLLGGRHYLTLAILAQHSEWAHGLVACSSVIAGLCFIIAYAGLTAMSVPRVAILTVVGATIGATAIFLATRAGLSGLVERADPRACRLKAGFGAGALNYLLVLRLVPIYPFWLVNLVAAVAGIRFSTYVLGTFLGIIPGAFVLGNGIDDIVAANRAPDILILFRSGALAPPLVGLAVLALVSVVQALASTDGREHGCVNRSPSITASSLTW